MIRYECAMSIDIKALPVPIDIPSEPAAIKKMAFIKLAAPVKIGFVSALLLAGAYGMFSGRNCVSAEGAVVSAYVTSVRVPITGELTGLHAVPGEHIEANALLARVTNPRASEDRLVSLALEQQQAETERRASIAEEAALLSERGLLQDRVVAHRQAVCERLQHQASQSEMLLAAKRAALQQANLDLERAQKLQQDGIVTQSEVNNLQTQRDMRSGEAAAQEADLLAIRSAEAAAEKGLLTEQGITNDVVFSQQRIDDITIRLAEVHRRTSLTSAQAQQAAAGVETQKQHLDLMRQADLVAPIEGTVWKLGAADGEHLESNATVAELIDCRQSFLLALIPQNRVPDVQVGADVRFRLGGESVEHHGTLSAIFGEDQDMDDHKLAARPVKDSTDRMSTVRVNYAHDAQEGCTVGRSARVLISTHGSMLPRMFP